MRSDAMVAQAEAYENLSRKAAMTLESATVHAGAVLANVSVRNANFPEEAILGAIRRGSATVVPRGSTLIHPGDELILLTTQEKSPQIREWLTEKTQ
ncbi:MAG: potassium transporter peripheral membrane component [Candidatus Hydrogenedentes bacterium ADurb.Bin179]|nr:MAG: potassium transporter peripheral membrane component [Candidatus Hydrogenedentes bacterium ADurb.Bin179]